MRMNFLPPEHVASMAVVVTVAAAASAWVLYRALSSHKETQTQDGDGKTDSGN